VNSKIKRFLVRNRILLLFLAIFGGQAKHFFDEKYAWIFLLFAFLGCANFLYTIRFDELETLKQTPRQKIWALGFWVLFISVAIGYNWNSWFLFVLVPVFLCFLLSLIMRIRQELKNTRGTSLLSSETR
jgi:hypothetical protein